MGRGDQSPEGARGQLGRRAAVRAHTCQVQMRPPGASEAGSGPLGDPQRALLAPSAALERKGSAARQLASPPGCRAARESDCGGRATAEGERPADLVGLHEPWLRLRVQVLFTVAPTRPEKSDFSQLLPFRVKFDLLCPISWDFMRT